MNRKNRTPYSITPRQLMAHLAADESRYMTVALNTSYLYPKESAYSCLKEADGALITDEISYAVLARVLNDKFVASNETRYHNAIYRMTPEGREWSKTTRG